MSFDEIFNHILARNINLQQVSQKNLEQLLDELEGRKDPIVRERVRLERILRENDMTSPVDRIPFEDEHLRLSDIEDYYWDVIDLIGDELDRRRHAVRTFPSAEEGKAEEGKAEEEETKEETHLQETKEGEPDEKRQKKEGSGYSNLVVPINRKFLPFY